jgi:ABC-2 type transport system permease protein
MDENKKVKTRKLSAAASKRGAYTAAISALVIAIVVVFNLVVGGLPAGTLEYDITGKDVYTVTEQSVEYLKTLDKDVDIVVLAQSSAIDQHLLKLINNYARLNSHLKLQIIDPVLDPTALTTWNAKENNVVVKCAETDRTKVLNMAGFQGYTEGLMLYDAQTYQYYQQLKPVALDAEGQLTSAVNYVTSTAANKMYLLSGHGEASLGTNATEYISKSGIETASVNLLTDGGVPSGCQLLMCYNPSTDMNADELSMLETYLRNGGKMILLLDNPELANFNALMAVYGLQMQNGVVGDNDRNYKAYVQQNGIFCIDPILSTSSDVTSNVTNKAILRAPRGMLQVTPERRASTLTPFMTTSQNGILQGNDNATTAGQYILGATATESFADKPTIQTRFTVITAIDLISDDIPTNVSFSNMDIFMNAVVKNYPDVQNFVIPTKTLDITPITVMNPVVWIVVIIGVIIAILVGGLVYWTKRRNR